MPFAELGEVRLFFTDEGAGDPPLLFVHGYACDSHDWSWQLPHFAVGHRVIAVDLRGHGRSSAPQDGYDVLTFASDLAGLVEQLACGPVVAVGHSLGGAIASALAIERPDLVRAVVSVDPGYLLPDGMRGLLDPTLEALDEEDPAAVIAQGMLVAHTSASPVALTTWHVRRILGVPVHVLRQTMTNFMRGHALASYSAPYLARRTCPVLAFYADPSRAAAESALFDDDRSRVVTFEGSGHWLHQERPAEVNAIIDSWFASL
jgi:pimeloyl-ACP methyl ester carboxylesterase